MQTIDHDREELDVVVGGEQRDHLVHGAHLSNVHFDLVAAVEQHVVQSGDGVRHDCLGRCARRRIELK